jgi:hypothetical protein
VEAQPSLERRGNIRPPSRGLKPMAKFKAPLCGGGICQVNLESRLHIFPKRRKQSSPWRLLFKIKFEKVTAGRISCERFLRQKESFECLHCLPNCCP